MYGYNVCVCVRVCVSVCVCVFVCMHVCVACVCVWASHLCMQHFTMTFINFVRRDLRQVRLLGSKPDQNKQGTIN